MNSALFSSANDVWETPQEFFDKLNEEFHFTLDPCALPANAKCEHYFTPTDNGLIQSWEGETVFCNPPYGRAIYNWVRKCSEEARKKTPRWLPLYQREQIRDTFTNLSIIKRKKYGLFAVA